jgi:cell wall integrity and stress response component
MAMTEGSNCYCGDMLPAESDKVDSSYCDTPCDGYDQETCMSPSAHYYSCADY